MASLPQSAHWKGNLPNAIKISKLTQSELSRAKELRDSSDGKWPNFTVLCVNWATAAVWSTAGPGRMQAGKTLGLNQRKEFYGNSGKCLSWPPSHGAPWQWRKGQRQPLCPHLPITPWGADAHNSGRGHLSICPVSLEEWDYSTEEMLLLIQLKLWK